MGVGGDLGVAVMHVVAVELLSVISVQCCACLGQGRGKAYLLGLLFCATDVWCLRVALLVRLLICFAKAVLLSPLLELKVPRRRRLARSRFCCCLSLLWLSCFNFQDEACQTMRGLLPHALGCFRIHRFSEMVSRQPPTASFQVFSATASLSTIAPTSLPIGHTTIYCLLRAITKTLRVSPRIIESSGS